MSELRTLQLAEIRPSLNARGHIGDIEELALSLKVLGLQKPLIVIPRHDEGYDILDGHRRHAAAVRAGLTTVEAIVRAELGEAGRIQAQLAMATHAKQFDPISEARALHALMFTHNLSREQISRAVGRPPSWVRDRISLAHLTPSEQTQVQRGALSITEAIHRLKVRRAERSSVGPALEPKRTDQPRQAYRVPHFTNDHELSGPARRLCDNLPGHGQRATLGGVACGECWEAAIRADVTRSAGVS